MNCSELETIYKNQIVFYEVYIYTYIFIKIHLFNLEKKYTVGVVFAKKWYNLFT